MKKKCKVCKRLLDIKRYGKQWNKKQQHYYITPACRECIAKRQNKYRKLPHHIQRWTKYIDKGFYGWNIKLERELSRTNHRLQSLEFRNEWEKKCDNLGEISKRDKKDFKKRISKFLTLKEKEKKIIKTEINRLKSRNTKLTTFRVISEMIYGGPIQAQTTIFTRLNQSTWARKIDKLVDMNKRSIRYRGA